MKEIIPKTKPQRRRGTETTLLVSEPVPELLDFCAFSVSLCLCGGVVTAEIQDFKKESLNKT